MAMGAPSSGNAFNADINVTPMIDILLVLLIIFMMQVPLTRKVMEVNVPPEDQPQQKQQQQSNQIVLELKDDGTYSVNGAEVPKSQLDAKFHEVYDNRPAKILFVKTGPSRIYQDVIEAMDIARGAGVQVIGFTPPGTH
jgi:biopolymer transport protein ExbD